MAYEHFTNICPLNHYFLNIYHWILLLIRYHSHHHYYFYFKSLPLLIEAYLFLPPSENDSFLCILTFVLVYYFSMVGAVWFVILAFSWSICFKSLGSTRDNFAGKVVYFHSIAWTIPLSLAISVLSLKQVILSIWVSNFMLFFGTLWPYYAELSGELKNCSR